MQWRCAASVLPRVSHPSRLHGIGKIRFHVRRNEVWSNKNSLQNQSDGSQVKGVSQFLTHVCFKLVGKFLHEVPGICLLHGLFNLKPDQAMILSSWYPHPHHYPSFFTSHHSQTDSGTNCNRDQPAHRHTRRHTSQTSSRGTFAAMP